MKKDLATGLINNLRVVFEGYTKDFEDKVKNFLKGLNEDQLQAMLGKENHTIIANGGDECSIMRFIRDQENGDFEGVEVLPIGEDESNGIIIRFDELTLTQLMHLVEIAVLGVK